MNPEQTDWIVRIENHAFTLNLFRSLLVSVSQIILQVYIMAILQHKSFWTSKYFYNFFLFNKKTMFLNLYY
jgi:hypothetical protein